MFLRLGRCRMERLAVGSVNAWFQGLRYKDVVTQNPEATDPEGEEPCQEREEPLGLLQILVLHPQEQENHEDANRYHDGPECSVFRHGNQLNVQRYPPLLLVESRYKDHKLKSSRAVCPKPKLLWALGLSNHVPRR